MMSIIDTRLIGSCVLMLFGSALQAPAQTSSQGLVQAIIQELAAVDSPAKPGPHFVDVTPVLGDLSRVLEQAVTPGDIGRTLPVAYLMAARDSVIKCPGGRPVDCAIQNGGVVIRVDSLSGDRSAVRAVVTRWDNSIMGRGVFRSTWAIILERREKGWTPIKRTLLRQS